MLKTIRGLCLREQERVGCDPCHKGLFKPLFGFENIRGVDEDGHMTENALQMIKNRGLALRLD